MSVVAFIQSLLDAGLSLQDAMKAAAAFEEATAVAAPTYVRRVPSDWSARRAEALAQYGERCSYCGTFDGPWEVDHIHPVRLGGGHDLDNLAVACVPCNRSKKDRPLSEWRGR